MGRCRGPVILIQEVYASEFRAISKFSYCKIATRRSRFCDVNYVRGVIENKKNLCLHLKNLEPKVGTIKHDRLTDTYMLIYALFVCFICNDFLM